jgi:hypothetical protein
MRLRRATSAVPVAPSARFTLATLATWATLAAFSGFATPHEAEAAGSDAGAPPLVPACIQVTHEARYVPYGYNHIVTLKNGCSKDAVCQVASDVNPQATTAEVAKGTTLEVVTFMGSPSAAFEPRVRCTLR